MVKFASIALILFALTGCACGTGSNRGLSPATRRQNATGRLGYDCPVRELISPVGGNPNRGIVMTLPG